jgi:acetyl esterase
MRRTGTELPGRLGDPEMELHSDPRSDLKMIKLLAPLGRDRNVPPPEGVSRQSSREEQLAWAEEFDRGLEAALTQANEGAVVPDDVEEKTHSIRGRDGNEILLYMPVPFPRRAPCPGWCTCMVAGGSRCPPPSRATSSCASPSRAGASW